MRTFVVTIPWRKGQVAGEQFKTAHLNPVLNGHVKELIEDKDQKLEVATPKRQAKPKEE